MSRNAPRGLNTAGKALWKGVVDTHELRADEYRMLEDACREADLVDVMEAARNEPGFSLMVRGSQGQMVINPIINEIRQHRTTLASLLGKLKLTESEGETASEVSTKARMAANKRWAAVRPA